MITISSKEKIVNALACQVSLAHSDFKGKKINKRAYESILTNAVALASVHLGCLTELRTKLKQMGLEF